jgi:hypothetical protein
MQAPKFRRLFRRRGSAQPPAALKTDVAEQTRTTDKVAAS